jgi:hypothetical protein
MSASLDETLGGFEKGLNVLGYIPGVSTFSGTIRILYGKIEIISGLAIALISSCFRANDRQIAHGMELVVHGIANLGRGLVELIPFFNLICIPYDMYNRFEYQSLRYRWILHI